MRHACFPWVSEELVPTARLPMLAPGVLVGPGMVLPPSEPSFPPRTLARTGDLLVLGVNYPIMPILLQGR